MLFKTLAADWCEDGTVLLNHQHGGGYGIDRVCANEEYETRVSDRFYTFGWAGQTPKQVPLACGLSASQFKTSSKAPRILLTCNSYPKHVFRLHFQPMPGTIERMIAETRNFVSRMRGVRELVLRPHMNDIWQMTDLLRKIEPNLSMDDTRKSGLESYAASALVVHEVLNTSWLETLALNIPTVCFYDPDTYSFRDGAQPYIDRLSSVGILHRSGFEAADFVLSIKNNVQGWWQDHEVQDARRGFASTYANFSPAWPSHWEHEFHRWLD
jgi:putative transferase (TIGR04331 family)